MFLATSIVVAILRSLFPFTLNFDHAAQLESAYRLVQGLGLTSTVFAVHNPDISYSPIPQYLTWWPPGLSILSALYLALHLPLVPTMKLVNSLFTVVG
ncbi:MAG: hypothetical protein RML75_14535, partial [Cyanobacteriota bacterium SKYGB_h_bin112]|nr:hypothetical protein [Cyanobacteriota bacterium SKYGB_h_bin112]